MPLTAKCKDDDKRFWSKVRKTRNGCWEWKAGIRVDGYGSFWKDGKTVLAHRFSWEYFNGQPLDGLCMLHHCDNRACVNPMHLFMGTRLDNNQDAGRKGKKRGEMNGQAKLHNSDIPIILDLHKQGFSQTYIAQKFQVKQNTISRVINGKTWKHCPCGAPIKVIEEEK